MEYYSTNCELGYKQSTFSSSLFLAKVRKGGFIFIFNIHFTKGWLSKLKNNREWEYKQYRENIPQEQMNEIVLDVKIDKTQHK